MTPEFEAWMLRLEQWVAAVSAEEKPLSAASIAVYRSMWRALGRALPLASATPDAFTESHWTSSNSTVSLGDAISSY